MMGYYVVHYIYENVTLKEYNTTYGQLFKAGKVSVKAVYLIIIQDNIIFLDLKIINMFNLIHKHSSASLYIFLIFLRCDKHTKIVLLYETIKKKHQDVQFVSVMETVITY